MPLMDMRCYYGSFAIKKQSSSKEKTKLRITEGMREKEVKDNPNVKNMNFRYEEKAVFDLSIKKMFRLKHRITSWPF